MEIARAVQEELAKRDEIILALEMLVVDQASRLLALESIVVNMESASEVSIDNVKERISGESSRFKAYLQGDGLSGFLQRAHGVAEKLIGTVTTRD
tara:strand:+ start:239 stop:526 length:288 start_codon:yes stop_codon:yes gene_type:complete